MDLLTKIITVYFALIWLALIAAGVVLAVMFPAWTPLDALR